MKPEAERVCRSFPAVRTWLEKQRDKLDIREAESIKYDICQLVGEDANESIFDSLHVPKEEREFLRSREAREAILEAISDAIGV